MVIFEKILHMPSPLIRWNFTEIRNQKLLSTVDQLANDSMNTSALQVKESSENEKGECKISLGGTWQKRVHTSHNVVITANSKVTKNVLM